MRLASRAGLSLLYSTLARAAVRVNFRRTHNDLTYDEDGLQRRSIDVSMDNDQKLGAYTATIQVGTPPQDVDVLVDTGSSDIWFLSPTTDVCQKKQCTTPWDRAKSTSCKDAGVDKFAITYLDTSASRGTYFNDTLTVAGSTVENVRLAQADTSNMTTAIMGLGYPGNQVATTLYPSLVEDMVLQGLIKSKTYSLYLDSVAASTGSIVFGGLDAARYSGELSAVPITRSSSGEYVEFDIPLTSLVLNLDDQHAEPLDLGAPNIPAILDSGTTYTFLPPSVTTRLYALLKAYDDTDTSRNEQATGNIYVSCDLSKTQARMAVTYSFAGATIRVPISELVYTGVSTPSADLAKKFNFTGSACGLGIRPAVREGRNMLGDTFLRSAYVVYDMENNQIALAQTRFGVGEGNLIDIEAGSPIPGAKTVVVDGVVPVPAGADGLAAGFSLQQVASSVATSTTSRSTTIITTAKAAIPSDLVVDNAFLSSGSGLIKAGDATEEGNRGVTIGTASGASTVMNSASASATSNPSLRATIGSTNAGSSSSSLRATVGSTNANPSLQATVGSTQASGSLVATIGSTDPTSLVATVGSTVPVESASSSTTLATSTTTSTESSVVKTLPTLGIKQDSAASVMERPWEQEGIGVAAGFGLVAFLVGVLLLV